MLLFAFALLFTVLVILLLRKAAKRYQKVQSLLTTLWNKIFFNTIIRYILQSSLKMQMAAATVIVLTKDGSSPMSSLLTLIAFNLFPFFFFVTLCCKRTKLRREETRQKIGSLYLTLRASDMWTLA